MSGITTEALSAAVRETVSVGALLERRAEDHPDRVLLRWEAENYTYGQVEEMANTVANSLLERGVKPGDRVAVMMANSPEWVGVWLGIAKAGAVAVTINTAYLGDGLAYQLQDCGARATVVDEEFAPRLDAIAGEIPTSQMFVKPQGGELAAGADPLDKLFAGSSARPAIPPLGPQSPCSILYTSGTTGPAKGCLLPHGQYLAAAFLHAANCGYGPETTLYTCLPLFHINAQNYSLLSAMSVGGTLALDAKFTASGFWERLIEVGATAFNFIGFVAQALWNREPSPAEREHRATVAFGAPVPLNIWEAWEERFGCRIVYAYGMTENALPAIFPLADTPAAPEVRGAGGKASPTSDVAIVDDHDFPVPPGTVGEIVTRPKIPWTMMLEYFNRPDATRDAFRNCWFHTGDLGYLDDSGFVFWVDRKKDALRRRGEMVSSWDVEAVVAKFPGVAECAVVGVPSEMSEDDILVAVVPAERLDPADLVAFCRERMAAFQVPRYVRFVDSLPRTQTQRVEKYRLRADGATEDTWDANRVKN
ncbi:MAG: AMP-binding protein [Acidimicrobiia bacterium]